MDYSDPSRLFAGPEKVEERATKDLKRRRKKTSHSSSLPIFRLPFPLLFHISHRSFLSHQVPFRSIFLLFLHLLLQIDSFLSFIDSRSLPSTLAHSFLADGVRKGRSNTNEQRIEGRAENEYAVGDEVGKLNERKRKRKKKGRMWEVGSEGREWDYKV